MRLFVLWFLHSDLQTFLHKTDKWGLLWLIPVLEYIQAWVIKSYFMINPSWPLIFANMTFEARTSPKCSHLFLVPLSAFPENRINTPSKTVASKSRIQKSKGAGQSDRSKGQVLSVAKGGIYRLSLQQKEALLNISGIIWNPNLCTCLFFLNAHKNVSIGPIKMISLL